MRPQFLPNALLELRGRSECGRRRYRLMAAAPPRCGPAGPCRPAAPSLAWNRAWQEPTEGPRRSGEWIAVSARAGLLLKAFHSQEPGAPLPNLSTRYNSPWVGRRRPPIQLGLALAPALTRCLFAAHGQRQPRNQTAGFQRAPELSRPSRELLSRMSHIARRYATSHALRISLNVRAAIRRNTSARSGCPHRTSSGNWPGTGHHVSCCERRTR